MRYLFILLMTVSLSAKSQNIFQDFDDFLNKNVVFGLVDYAKLKKNPDQLLKLVGKIENYSMANTDQVTKTAFYINSYNILVIKQIVDNYPIKKPLDIDGFFNKTKFMIGGESLTLDDVEFKKLLGRTKDPRIHFTLGCGAKSCPYLFEDAFTPEKLEEQLSFRASEIIERPNYVFVDEERNTVLLNKIFDWYKDQFIADAGSIIKYINRHKQKKIPEVYLVKFQEYDWSLNDVK